MNKALSIQNMNYAVSIRILCNNHSDRGEEDLLIAAVKGSNVCVLKYVTLLMCHVLRCIHTK